MVSRILKGVSCNFMLALFLADQLKLKYFQNQA